MGNFDPYISFIHSIILTTTVNVTCLHFTCMAAGPAAKLSEFSLCCCSLHAKMTKKQGKKVSQQKTCTDSAVNHRCWCTRVVSFPVSFPVSRVPEQGSLGKKTSISLIPRPRPAFHHLHAQGEPGNEARLALRCMYLFSLDL